MKRSGYLSRRVGLKRGKPIRRVSAARAKALAIYTAKRRTFLAANPVCAVCAKARSAEVHHKSGRYGSAFLDEHTWLAACKACHRAIHEGPGEARAKGLLK